MDSKITDINFINEIHLKGSWWIKPEKKVNGTLEFIPGEKNELIIYGSLKDELLFSQTIDKGNGVYEKHEPSNKPYTIYGLTETNENVTLINCFLTRQDGSLFGSVDKTVYIVQYSIFGSYVNDLESLPISSLNIKINGLLQFVGRYNNTIISSQDMTKINIRSFQVKDFEITLYSDLIKENTTTFDNKKHFVYKLEPYIKISSLDNIKTYEELIDMFDKFKDLIILGLNNSLELNTITCKYNNNCLSVLFVHEYKLRLNQEIFKLNDISDITMHNWFNLYNEVPNIIQLLRSTIQNEYTKRLFIDNKFFNLATIFESLHDHIYK